VGLLLRSPSPSFSHAAFKAGVGLFGMPFVRAVSRLFRAFSASGERAEL